MNNLLILQVSHQADNVGIILALESKDLNVLNQAKQDLLQQLPPGSVISEERDPTTLGHHALT